MLTFLHDPRSPLSHRALRALAEEADAIDVIDVVETAPDDHELAEFVRALPCGVRDLLDRSGSLYMTLELDDPRWSDTEVMAAAFDNPVLLRCPILIGGERVHVADAALAARAAELGAAVGDEAVSASA